MIVFDLKCKFGHVFEAWFGSNDAYEAQKKGSEIECPVCGSRGIDKAIMAPNVAAKGNRRNSNAPPAFNADGGERPDFVEPVGMTALPGDLKAELEDVLSKVQRHVEETCEYVGDDFPEEARKIHYGEAPDRGIYGEATVEESEELLEEGIEIMSLPMTRKSGLSDA
ncbi:MAG: DUF1178 family protein [Sphingomonadales bacterium]